MISPCEFDDGKLELCLRDAILTKTPRPKEFKTKEGSGIGLIVLERE
ncbi:MAG: hypothetical protein WD069_20680 [Planctomycetales bacterium]